MTELIRALSSADWSVRFNAIRELGTQRCEQAADELGRCLEDPDPDIRYAALQALQSIGSERALGHVAAFQEVEKKVLLEESARTVLDPKKKSSARLDALEHLMKENYAGLSELAGKCANDRDVKVQRAAVRWMARTGDAATQPLLREKLSHSDVTLRAYAFQGLCRFPGSLKLDEVFGFLGDSDNAARFSAIRKLREVGGLATLPAVEERIRKLIPGMGWDSPENFDSQWGDLERHLRGQSGTHGREMIEGTLHGEIVELLETYRALSSDGQTWELFKKLQAEFRPLSRQEKRMARIEEARAKVEGLVRQVAADPNVSASDVIVLGEYYFDLYVVPFLLACGRGEHQVEWVPGKRLPGVLQASPDMSFERSWLGLGDSFALRFRNREKQAEAIIDALCQVLRKHGDGSVRWRAANVLRALKDERALPALRDATKDPEADVRSEAEDACREIGLCGVRFGRTYELGQE